MSKVTYLVTGAAGFLGSNVCRELVSRGEKVRAFVLPNDRGAKYIPKEVEIVYGDLLNMESLEKFFTVPAGEKTICLHIASVVAVTAEYSQVVMNVNVQGTKNIITCCESHPECERLVYCSSTGAIPELEKGRMITEVDHFDASKVVGCYSQSKALATQAVLDAVHNDDLDACVVHPSGILGPNDYAVGPVTSMLLQIIAGELKGGIDGSFNLCDVRDLAHGCIEAATRGRKGECYILGNDVVTFREFTRIMAEESGAKAPKMFLPISLAMFMAKASENLSRVTGKKPLMTSFAVYNLARNNSFDSSKAERELDYHTRSYQETIRDMIAWMREDNLIAEDGTVLYGQTAKA